jgi:hypothetical protein
MTDAPAAKLTWDKLIPIAMSATGLAVVLGGVTSDDGKRSQKLEDFGVRIQKLEAADSAKTDLLRTIDGRTIRIETKLELIVPAKAGASR